MHVTAARPAPRRPTPPARPPTDPSSRVICDHHPHGRLGHVHSIVPAGTATGTRERFRLTGPGTPTVTADGTGVTVTERVVELDVPEGTTNSRSSLPGRPCATAGVRAQVHQGLAQDRRLERHPAEVRGRRGRPRSLRTRRGRLPARHWRDSIPTRLARRPRGHRGGVKPTVTITASASWESNNRQDEDQSLSERRRYVAVAAVSNHGTVTGNTATGFSAAQPPAKTTTGTARPSSLRSSHSPPTPDPRSLPCHPAHPDPRPPPQPHPSDPPPRCRASRPAFSPRGGGVKVTATSQYCWRSAPPRLRDRPRGEDRNSNGAPAINGNLQLKQQPGAAADAAANPQDGVVDARLTIVHDPATHSWTETLALRPPRRRRRPAPGPQSHTGSATADTGSRTPSAR